MCGIAGFTRRSGVAAEPVHAALQAIAHRGPDQRGTFISGAVAMGAVRLKILDLNSGNQPLASPDGRTILCYNGEVYNYRELRSELEGRGHRFRTETDSEVVLAGWLEWRHAAFERLRGMFALAIWEEGRGRLVLARDRLGIKPLYVCRLGEDIYFGSELKAIFASPEVPRRIDSEALSYYLALNYVPHPFTLVQGIRKLQPGAWLEWCDGRVKEDRYWRLQFAPHPKTLPDAVAELDHLMEQSVREHLVSDVPLGVWLSGGLDSSTITHYASRAAGRKLQTFSVSFAGRSFDETPYFRQVASKFGTDHHEFDLSPDRDLPAVIERMAWHSDEPSADAGALPVWYLSGMCRRHVTVALSGEGADEIFGGYVTYTADRYAQWMRLVPAGLRRLMLSAAQYLLPVSNDKISFEFKVKRFLEGSLLDPVDAHLFWNGACSARQRRLLLRQQAVPDPARLFPELPDVGPLNRYLYLDHLLYLPEDILTKCDRMSMAHSLEVRPPFLDHRIVEFAARLPEDLKVRGSKLKFVLRELMRGKLPPDVLSRSKQGFDIPAHHWFRTRLKTFLLDTVTPDAVRATGLFDPLAVDRLIQDHMARRINAGYPLWGLLTLFLWIRQWKIDTAIEPHPGAPFSSASSRS